MTPTPPPSHDAPPTPPESPAPVAYLVNAYPKVSHTFIRREIEALERLGQPVLRFSIRGSRGLVDPADVAERERTTVLLDHARLWPSVLRALRRPHALVRGMRHARAMAVSAGGGFSGRFRHGIYLAEAWRLREITAAAGVRHLHAHFGTNPAAVARLCHLLGGPAYSFTVHGPEEFDHPVQLSLAAKVADSRFVAGVSSFGRSQLMRWLNRGLWDRVRVVRCGLDAAWLAEDPGRTHGPAAGEGEQGGAGDPGEPGDLFVCVGRLCEQKGQHMLVDAVDLLTQRGISVRLRLIGDGPMREALERSAADRGIADRVEFTGNASSAQVRAHLREARALVLPSFAEGLPVVIMEALAMRRPVVSTFVAGIPELVDDGCGILVPAGDLDRLPDAMSELLAAEPAAIAALGAEGRRRVCLHHDAEKNAADLLRHFDALDAEATAPPIPPERPERTTPLPETPDEAPAGVVPTRS